MTSSSQLRPARQTDLDVRHLSDPIPAFLQYLWLSVGGPWSWGDRLSWTGEQWEQLATDSQTSTWVGYHDGTPAGFYELQRRHDDVEIMFFGLLPHFIGRGYGGHLLTHAVQEAWAGGASRVWLHTCSWDGPNAVPNYEARGFVKFDEKTEIWQVPDRYDVALSVRPVGRPASHPRM